MPQGDPNRPQYRGIPLPSPYLSELERKRRKREKKINSKVIKRSGIILIIMIVIFSIPLLLLQLYCCTVIVFIGLGLLMWLSFVIDDAFYS